MSERRILHAGMNDLGVLLPLFRAYLQFYGRSPAAEDCEAFLRERLTTARAHVWIALLDGTAVGFALVYPGFSSLALKPSHTLNDLYVAPQARRTGVARALIDAVRDHAVACGAKDVVLQTAHDNAAAQALYRAAGYVRDDVFATYTLTLAQTAATAA